MCQGTDTDCILPPSPTCTARCTDPCHRGNTKTKPKQNQGEGRAIGFISWSRQSKHSFKEPVSGNLPCFQPPCRRYRPVPVGGRAASPRTAVPRRVPYLLSQAQLPGANVTRGLGIPLPVAPEPHVPLTSMSAGEESGSQSIHTPALSMSDCRASRRITKIRSSSPTRC